MKGAHRHLRAGLADGLGADDAGRLRRVDAGVVELPQREVGRQPELGVRELAVEAAVHNLADDALRQRGVLLRQVLDDHLVLLELGRVARLHPHDVLLSGWIRGEDRLTRRAAAVAMTYGKGKLVLLGFRAQHRAQTNGTYPFLFNALYWSVQK